MQYTNSHSHQTSQGNKHPVGVQQQSILLLSISFLEEHRLPTIPCHTKQSSSTFVSKLSSTIPSMLVTMRSPPLP